MLQDKAQGRQAQRSLLLTSAEAGGCAIRTPLVGMCWPRLDSQREYPQIGFMGPAIFLTQLGRVSTPMGAVACMVSNWLTHCPSASSTFNPLFLVAK